MHDIFAIGEDIPRFITPRSMHAWVIRQDRHGDPATAFQQEVVPVPEIGSNDVLIKVMAAGVNYNGVWAALGKPVSPFDIHKQSAHIAGSDAAGVVWKIGDNVKRWKPGDEVVVQCAQYDGEDPECYGGDPMLSPSQRIWGYETADGAFAQFASVKQNQLLERPAHLGWAESACYLLTLATAWRMLFGHAPNDLQVGQNVLVWGGAGGVGSAALQLCNLAGANAIAIVSSDDRADFARSLGARGVINRSDFDCWGPVPEDRDGAARYHASRKAFGKAVRAATGGHDVDIVIEHPGRDTFGLSCFLVKGGGMVVFCAATSGYRFEFDARHVWMRQKRLQGSHYASLKEAAHANQLVIDGKLDPLLAAKFSWGNLPQAHMQLRENQHSPGNMSVLVQAQG